MAGGIGRAVARAAGGVIRRKNRRGEIEVLLIHRPKQRDWTFPKGRSAGWPKRGTRSTRCGG